MKAKKSLGQHFLKSERALNAMIDAADVVADDIILEIGPGNGELTRKLVFFAGKVIAVEKDEQLVEELKARFEPEIKKGRLDLICGDILKFDPEILRFYKDFGYKIVANIPYYITGAILKKFLSASYEPQSMVLLIQKEVAERIVGTGRHSVSTKKKASLMSLSVEAYGKPRYIETVKAGSFVPPPKVDSAILSIQNISKNFFDKFSEETFFETLRAGFSSKRKKLSSNLVKLHPKEAIAKAFDSLELDKNARAEDISIDEWKRLLIYLMHEL